MSPNLATSAAGAQSAPGDSDAILAVSDLCVSFGALAAVAHVSFEAARGHVTSVIGPNGAGKSTLFNLVSGAIRPDRGQVRFDGRTVTGERPERLLRAGMARSFQITNLFAELSVRENLRIASQFLEGGRGWLGPAAASRQAAARVDELVELFGMQRHLEALAGVLSHGEQRRLEIAMAIASRPRMLLLDEPTQGMSHADTQDTAALVRRLVREQGLSLLLVEHDVDLVMELSDHVVVMHQGRCIAAGTPQAVRADPAVQSAYFGEARHA